MEARLSDVLVSGINVYVGDRKGSPSFTALAGDLNDDRIERRPCALTNEATKQCLLMTRKKPETNFGSFLRYASRTMIFHIVYFSSRLPADAFPIGLTKNRHDLVPWPLRYVDGFDIRAAIEKLGSPQPLSKIAAVLGVITSTLRTCVADALAEGYVRGGTRGEYYA